MPKRPDEVALWNAFGPDAEHETVREAAAALGIPDGRVIYLTGKWADQGIYDWGTVCDLGWKQ